MPLPIFTHSSLSLTGGGRYPINTSLPTVVGTPVVGDILTSNSGVWINNPTLYAIQWQRNQITNIASASGITYLVASADLGDTLNSVYTATNSYGSVSASSASTIAVMGGGGGGPSPPSGSPYSSLVYYNDFTTSASLNDFTKGSAGAFGYTLGATIAGGTLKSTMVTSAITWDGSSNLVITTSSAGGENYNAGIVSSANSGRTAGNTSSIPGYSGTVLAFTHGTWLARIQFPSGAGLWDAWWALPTNAGFTASQEMDWVEVLQGTTGNQSNTTYYATGHGGAGSSGSTPVSLAYTNSYHIYGGTIDTSGNGTWWLDGNSVKTLAQGSNWVGREWFMILNTAVGGWNQGTVDSTAFPNNMLVDWVAVWQ